jgi:hypothetical protein
MNIEIDPAEVEPIEAPNGDLIGVRYRGVGFAGDIGPVHIWPQVEGGKWAPGRFGDASPDQQALIRASLALRVQDCIAAMSAHARLEFFRKTQGFQ